MKRLLLITLSFLFILSFNNELKAQNKVQGSMTVVITDIKKVKKEKKEKKEKVKKEKKALEPIKAGYQQTVTFSTMTEFEDCLRFSFDYIGGYRINKNIFAGFGIGANIGATGSGANVNYSTYTYNYYSYDEPKNDIQLCRPNFSVPLYAHLRAYIGNKRCMPFVALSAGVDIAGSKEVDFLDSEGEYYYSTSYLCTRTCNMSSLFMEPMIGLDIRLNSKASLNFQLGANIHGVQWAKITNPGKLKIYKKAEGDFSFKLGCTF